MKIVQLETHNHEQIISQAIEVLQKDGLVIYPTETCYGIGALATSQVAVEKLLAYKTHRSNKPISIAVVDMAMAEQYTVVNNTAKNLYENFLPGPITVVSLGKHKVAARIESNTGTLGVRIPDYPFVLNLIKKLQTPITATSANASYKKTPYAIEDIVDNTSKKQQSLVDLVIDAGTLPRRKPSVVVDTTLESMQILREGDMKLEDYREIVTTNEQQTREFAASLHQELESFLGNKAIVIAMCGDLGTGKTFISRALGELWGVNKTIVSPTFILCREYPVVYQNRPFQLFHIDTYRMYEAEELGELGESQMFQANNVVIIEWSDKFMEYIEQQAKNAVLVKIILQHIDENSRRIKYSIRK